MKAFEECPRFDFCNASVCPLHDREYLLVLRGFYADEDEICAAQGAGKYRIVNIMRRIKKAGGTGLFTIEMLESLNRVYKGIIGLPFEASYAPGPRQAGKKWIAARKKKAETISKIRHKRVFKQVNRPASACSGHPDTSGCHFTFESLEQ